MAELTGETRERRERAAGLQALVDRQSSKPESRFTPCNLVSERRRAEIVGAPIEQPLEAPQGPTCIYRSRDGKSFVTVAVQRVSIDSLTGRLQQRETVDVGSRAAYCGKYGQPMLYLPLGGGGCSRSPANAAWRGASPPKALPQLLD